LARYRPEDIVGFLDNKFAGQDTKELLGIPNSFPIFATLEDAMQAKPDSLVIGVAPQGGRLDPQWRSLLLDAIQRGLDIYSGLHEILNDDDEFAAAAKQSGGTLYDVRQPPEDLPIGKAFARKTKALRLLAIGTDCNVGKMVAMLELNQALKDQGLKSEFIATGQSGILISGKGIAIDRVISDFAAGAAEKMVLENQDADVLLVEGQGALTHPGFSGVTLSLLHGTLPHGVILCHRPGRETMRGNDVPVSSLRTHIELCERLCEPIFPTKVIGVVINGYGFSDEEFNNEIKKAQDETGLPVVDVIRTGPQALIEPILKLRDDMQTL
ncbi:DUF1611 domain-containing protein, partial [bacterium]|nr:DUF1611 domain-containing protein [bacterium]